MNPDAPAGDLFRVLADPTRRELFERIVAGGELPVVALVAGSRVSQPAVSQHLAALRSVGLVAKRKVGRNVLYRVPRGALLPIAAWLRHHGPELEFGSTPGPPPGGGSLLRSASVRLNPHDYPRGERRRDTGPEGSPGSGRFGRVPE